MYTVSNGLSFFRQFNKVFSGRGRVAFETGEEPAGHREAICIYRVDHGRPFPDPVPVSHVQRQERKPSPGKRTPTYRYCYIISPNCTKGSTRTSAAGSVSRRTTRGGRIRNTQVNAGATFVPNRKVNLTLFYNGTTTVTSGGESGRGNNEFHARRGGRPGVHSRADSVPFRLLPDREVHRRLPAGTS